MNQLTEFFHDWNAFHFIIALFLLGFGVKGFYNVIRDAINDWNNDEVHVMLTLTWLEHLIEKESDGRLKGKDFLFVQTSSITGNKCIQIVCEGLFYFDDQHEIEMNKNLWESLFHLHQGSLRSRGWKYVELEPDKNWKRLEKELFKLINK